VKVAGDSVEQTDVVCRLTRDTLGLITYADDTIRSILGWRPEQIIGWGSIDLVHPDDQPAALAAWFEMMANPGCTRSWRGRYRAADGRWRWVQTLNSNHLNDPDHPSVETLMSPAKPSYVGVEEELRAREQLLRRLAEALPVGVFQLDRNGQVTFTNDRFEEILGVPAASTFAEQFEVVVPDDQPALADALAAVIADRPVDNLELRFRVETPHPDFADIRACQMSLRALTDLKGSVTGAIGCLSDVTDSVELRRELQLRASTDGLTSCLNRTAVFELLDLALTKAAHDGTGVAVIFIDLDRFKEINDSFGHATGDQVLCMAAQRIRNSLRAGDSVGRIGGDEFLVICPGVPSVGRAVPVADRVSESLHHPFPFSDASIQIGASLGVAWAPPGSSCLDDLIARSDRAMYQSKHAGLGAVTVAA
jgi:diguanylate cyclase (GGDEF)-like protein/PAS domain S-box-containing protein